MSTLQVLNLPDGKFLLVHAEVSQEERASMRDDVMRRAKSQLGAEAIWVFTYPVEVIN